MLTLGSQWQIDDASVSFVTMRASGAGGQHVNTTDSAVQLRFDVAASGLPDYAIARLLALRDKRLSDDGQLVLKAQAHRSQARNKQDALDRLGAWLDESLRERKRRKPTRPSRAAKRKRVDDKRRRSQTKALRRTPND